MQPAIKELTTQWVRGWAASRGAATPATIDGGFRVDAGPRVRYVLHTYDSKTLGRLGRELTEPGTDIKIVGPTRELRAALPDGWTMYPPCTLMTTAFTHRDVVLPQPYTSRIKHDGCALLGLILSGGEVVSSGRLAMTGRYGIIDQVWTRPAYQRRGLGRQLMTILGNRAADLGRNAGLLSATDDGRALYERLNWTARGEIAGAVRGAQ
jgi:GNAT superfamily N-acetyltransferase